MILRSSEMVFFAYRIFLGTFAFFYFISKLKVDISQMIVGLFNYKNGFDTGQKKIRCNRLVKVIVGTGFKTIVSVSPGGHHSGADNNKHVLELFFGPDDGQNIKPTHIRKADVQQHNVRGKTSQFANGIRPIG